MNKQWEWVFKDSDGKHNGKVVAIDPRDALSRMLTSDKGMSLAKKHGISPCILNDAPANADVRLDLTYEGFSIQLKHVLSDAELRHAVISIAEGMSKIRAENSQSA